MAGFRGVCLLGFIWPALSAESPGSSPEGPCDLHLRFRQGAAPPEASWLATGATLSSIWAMCLVAMYALHYVCGRKILCGCNAEEERHAPAEGSRDTEDGRVTASCASSSRGPACAVPRRCPRPPIHTRAQREYAQKLACMSQALESLMHDVQIQRRTWGNVTPTEPYPRSKGRKEKKVNITIYEMAA